MWWQACLRSLHSHTQGPLLACIHSTMENESLPSNFTLIIRKQWAYTKVVSGLRPYRCLLRWCIIYILEDSDCAVMQLVPSKWRIQSGKRVSPEVQTDTYTDRGYGQHRKDEGSGHHPMRTWHPSLTASCSQNGTLRAWHSFLLSLMACWVVRINTCLFHNSIIVYW